MRRIISTSRTPPTKSCQRMSSSVWATAQGRTFVPIDGGYCRQVAETEVSREASYSVAIAFTDLMILVHGPGRAWKHCVPRMARIRNSQKTGQRNNILLVRFHVARDDRHVVTTTSTTFSTCTAARPSTSSVADIYYLVTSGGLRRLRP